MSFSGGADEGATQHDLPQSERTLRQAEIFGWAGVRQPGGRRESRAGPSPSCGKRKAVNPEKENVIRRRQEGGVGLLTPRTSTAIAHHHGHRRRPRSHKQLRAGWSIPHNRSKQSKVTTAKAFNDQINYLIAIFPNTEIQKNKHFFFFFNPIIWI